MIRGAWAAGGPVVGHGAQVTGRRCSSQRIRGRGTRKSPTPPQTQILKKLIPRALSACWAWMLSWNSSPDQTRTPIAIRTTPPAAITT